MATSLVEFNALLDNFVPLVKKVSTAKIEAMQKEADCLEKILARVWMVMPYLHENGEPGQCPLINRVEEVPLSKDSGIRISNTLTLIEDGPHLVRSFTVEHWGMNLTPSFEINDTQYVSCEVAVRTYGFEDICAGLADMLKCQISIDVEFKELQSRVEKADSLLVILEEKFKVECRQSESKQEVTI